ncbi:MAG: IPExxxVDY family protein [Bacteroidia bacterium]|nr:IPExxxVDY family protein [Bacteroidia bacterium]
MPFEEDILIYGIVSTEIPYRLVWYINKHYPFAFERVDDYTIIKDTIETSFAKYTFIHEENHTTYTLLANKKERINLIPELKTYDYLLLVSGAIDYLDEPALKAIFQQIPIVQIVYNINSDTIKTNLSYLIA